MSHAQLCDDRSDMGNLKSVSRLGAFNYIPIYIQCKKTFPFCTLSFKPITYDHNVEDFFTPFLKQVLDIDLFIESIFHANSDRQ